MPPKSIVVIAGIPADIEHEFTKKKAKLEEGIREIIFLPVKYGASYSPQYVQELYVSFSEAVKRLLPLDEANVDAPSWFDGAITIFFQFEEKKPTLLIDTFGVETFVVPARLPSKKLRNNATRNLINSIANDTVRVLRKLIRKSEAVLLAIKKEVTSNANRTPLLLPFSNFGMVDMNNLRDDVMNLIHSNDEFSALRDAVDQFRSRANLVRFGAARYWSYVNGKDIIFCRPSALHGFNWNLGEGHKSPAIFVVVCALARA